MKTILIVEDERKIALLLADYLRQAGYNPQMIDNGLEVIPWLESHTADAILLDIMLPGRDGLSLCQEIRQRWQTPIFMVTAKIEEIDRLLGLELGADDYICKPFSPREVVARLKALFRRLENLSATSAPSATERSGLMLDANRLEVRYGDQTCTLSTVEFQLLAKLASEPGRIFPRQQLMDVMYNDHRVVSDRTIDSHIKKIRKKLEALPLQDEVIYSVYGAGYKYEAPTPAKP